VTTNATGRRVQAVLASLLLAQALPCTAQPAQASRPLLRVALGESKPPYVMDDEDAGIEYSIVSSLLETAGYRVRVSFVPNRRGQLMLADGEVDAAISLDGPYQSEPYIAYKNMAITLCSKKIALTDVSGLSLHRVAAFQNAHLFLGPSFAAMAGNNPDYREISPQVGIDRLLYSGRIDVAVSDISIFTYFSRRLGPQFDTRQQLCAYPLFPPTLYRLSFRDPVARDRFNGALAAALKGELYERIAQRYQVSLSKGEPYFKPPSVPAAVERTPPMPQAPTAPMPR